MRQIVGEYEKTISQLIAEKEREKASQEASLQATIRERDQAVDDLKVRVHPFVFFVALLKAERDSEQGEVESFSQRTYVTGGKRLRLGQRHYGKVPM